MDCARFADRAGDYLENQVPRSERRDCEEHLSTCPACREQVARLRRTSRIAGSLREPAAPVSMPQRLRQAFREWARRR